MTPDEHITSLAKISTTRGYRQGLFRAAQIIAANHLADPHTLLELIKVEISIDDPGIYEAMIAEAKSK